MALPINKHTFRTRFHAIAFLLSEAELHALFEILQLEELDAGETLIVEGTPTDALFMVWDGELNVLVNTDDGLLEVDRASPGSLLGEISLMDPGPATATVRTEQGCTALVLDRRKLEALWRLHPRVARLFLGQLTREVAARIRLRHHQINTLHAKRASAAQS